MRAANFDLRDLPKEYFDSPHEYLKALRDFAPIHHNHDGSVLLTRHEDVRRVWRDLSAEVDKRALYAARFGPGDLYEHHTSTMLFRDPPDHDRLRAIVNPFFRPEVMLRLRAGIEAKVAGLVAMARSRGEIDFVAKFAYPVTIFTICRMLGLPEADGAMLGEWGRRIAVPLNPDADAATIARGHAAASNFKAYLADHLRAARATGRDADADLLGALVAAEREGARIDETEIQHMLILMINGGHESTSNLLSVGMLELVDDQARLADLRDPALPVSRAMEELVRVVTPLQLQGRRLTRPVALSAGELPAGTEVIVSVASANWDESVFIEPRRVRFDRKLEHVAFGAGVHVCIGRALAKLEAGIVLPAVARAFGRIERTAPVRFRATPRFRGIHALTLRLG